MPKGRHSNMHADGPGAGGGGGGGDYVPGGDGVEPQAIAVEPRTVTVEMFSRTRQQNEPLSITFTAGGGGGGSARVSSASGHEYETTVDSCTCPDFRIRHHECRHIRALRLAMGMGPLESDFRPISNTPETTVPPEIVNRAHQLDEEAAARLARFAELGDERFASEDEDYYQAVLHEAQQPPVYERENVLDGPEGNTFGVELEFVGGNRTAIAQDLYHAGLTRVPNQTGYHSGVSDKWRFERDGSVDGEVISPVLRDTPETWDQINQVCEIVRRHGGRVDARCGGHVHIGKSPLDENRFRKDRLLKIVAGNEDIYYRLAGSGEMNGQFRGDHYVRPVAGQFPTSIPRDDETAERRIGSDHYQAINMRPATVEFRYPNGSLTPEQIQANIKLAYHTVSAAATVRRETPRGQLIPTGAMPRGANRRQEDPNHIRRMIDLIFTKTKDKVSVLRQFTGSRWQ